MLLYTASFQPGNSVVFLPLSKGLHHCPRDCVVVLWCFKWLGRDRITNHGSSIVSFSLAGKTSTVKGKLVSLCRFQEQMFHKLAFFELNFLFFPYTMCRLHTIMCWTLGDYKQNEGFAWSIFVFFSLFFFPHPHHKCGQKKSHENKSKPEDTLVSHTCLNFFPNKTSVLAIGFMSLLWTCGLKLLLLRCSSNSHFSDLHLALLLSFTSLRKALSI